jgi:hypothetical protein
MGRYATDTGGGDFTPAPEGTHVARCIQLIDIGTHHGEYQGTPNVQNQVIVRWELPHETIDTERGPEPMIVSKFYTNSLGEKANLRKDLQSWRGRQFTPEELAKFDLESILGKPCLVTIVHNEKKKAKVTGVAGLTRGTTCPPAHNDFSSFWIDEWDNAKFEALPKGFQDFVVKSDEYKAMMSTGRTGTVATTGNDDPDSDVPF